jgi:membrane protein implicated in regulation of membrane protease activity
MAESLFGYSISLLLFLAGSGLVVAEAFAPGAHFIVVGMALLVAGLVGLLLPASLGIFAPIILASVVLVVAGVTLWGYREYALAGTTSADRTTDSASLQGELGRVTERVTRSTGEVKLEGAGFNPYFRARSVDAEIPEGEEVMVVDPGGGNVVTVEVVGHAGDDIDRELERGRRNPEESSDAESASDTETDLA